MPGFPEVVEHFHFNEASRLFLALLLEGTVFLIRPFFMHSLKSNNILTA